MARKHLFAPDIERALVGAALMDPASFLLEVDPADFHDALLERVWEVGRELATAGGWFDMLTLADELERQGMTGAFAKLSALLVTAEGVNAAAADQYAAKLRDLADRRRAELKIQQMHRTLYGANGTWRDDLAALTTGVNAVLTVTAAKPGRKTAWTGAELLAAIFPDPKWAVPDIVPVGLTYLAGRPKVGKSWLALQIAQAVATGGRVLDRQVDAGRVLYVALEDAPRRLAGRLRKQHAPADVGIDFALEWPRFTDGGVQALTERIGRDGYTLAIVDTFGRALGKADQDDPAVMTDIVGELQDYAGAHEASILLIDHHRKPAGFEGDPVDDILGSTAKAAVADAALGLFRQNGKREVVLKVTGRDVEWQELALTFDAVTCCWQLEGTAEEVALRGRKGDVLEALRELAPKEATLTELAELTRLDKGNLLRILNDLVDAGKIERLEKQGRSIPYRLRGDGNLEDAGE